MDNLYCYGTEARLEVGVHFVTLNCSTPLVQDCRFDGWGKNDCERVEAAGVRAPAIMAALGVLSGEV